MSGDRPRCRGAPLCATRPAAGTIDRLLRRRHPDAAPGRRLGAGAAAPAGVLRPRRDAEVTTEANPESVNRAYFDELRAGGFNRVSLGMQSASPSVLRVLDRRHTPGRAVAAAREAADAGFDRVSLDLIYGTPGETADQWRDTVQTAIDAGVGHVSAYALTVEPGTSMGAAIRRGEVPAPDPDVAAARYEVADDLLTDAGFGGTRFPTGLGRVTSAGTTSGTGHRDSTGGASVRGAHSLVGGIRFHNVKHPRDYARALRGGELPIAQRERLSDEERRIEAVMLGVRLRAGLSTVDLPAGSRAALNELGVGRACGADRGPAGDALPVRQTAGRPGDPAAARLIPSTGGRTDLASRC